MDTNIEKQIQIFIERGLEEDVRDGDHTSLACIPAKQKSKAKILIKEDCVFAGKELVEAVFRHVDPDVQFEWFVTDGENISNGTIAAYIIAHTQAILKGERLALNSIQRMCGIATLCREYAKEVEGTHVKILDTRKTTPLIRFLEKWAVRIGGCTNYRYGLYDRIMIKDNHVDGAGNMKNALDRVHDYLKSKNLSLPITVEVRDFKELKTVLDIGGIDQIMLDNFTPDQVREALEVVNGRFLVEASGGINLKNIRSYAVTGLDYVSSGALTHSVKAKDISLKIIETLS